MTFEELKRLTDGTIARFMCNGETYDIAYDSIYGHGVWYPGYGQQWLLTDQFMETDFYKHLSEVTHIEWTKENWRN